MDIGAVEADERNGDSEWWDEEDLTHAGDDCPDESDHFDMIHSLDDDLWWTNCGSRQEDDTWWASEGGESQTWTAEAEAWPTLASETHLRLAIPNSLI